jgi:hypothetical protein
MSLPSLEGILARAGMPATDMTRAAREQAILEAMRLDMAPALELLHQKAHEADRNAGSAEILEDPNSPLGKQLTRICAGTILREIAEREITHGKPLTFLNCCRVFIGRAPDDLALAQIESQAGPVAFADC